MNGLLKISVSVLMAASMLFSVEAGASASLDFDQGKTYFNSGDYQKAVDYFERARRQGLKSISLYYNLASSYYKLGDYDNARRNFQVVAEAPKMKALANFNLGLVAKKTGDYATARSYFEMVVNTGHDQKLVSMANAELNKLNMVSGSRGPAKPWNGYASISAGTDSNINIAPENGAPAEVSDSFMDGYLVLDYMLDGSRESGWQADAIVFGRNYMDSNLYDESQLGIGLKKLQQINNWSTYYQLHMDQFTYGNEDYQSIVKFEVNGQNKLSKYESYVLRYSFEIVSSDNVIYDYLEGNRQKFRAEYRLYGKRDSQRYYYEYEMNNREDTATTSYSPTRNGLRAMYTRYIDRDWSLAGDLGYRLSSYSDPVSASDRDEIRTKAAINLDYRIDKTLKLRTQASVTSNDSDDDIYDYDRTMISVKLSKIF